MPEYIEREALISDLKDLPEQERIEYMGIYDLVKSQTTVEVVRCSECKYFGKELKQGKHSCLNYQLPYCLENDYCSYGKRKDGD